MLIGALLCSLSYDLIVINWNPARFGRAWGSGYICVAVPPERLDELEIPLMIENNTEKHRTAYTHTVDYRPGE